MKGLGLSKEREGIYIEREIEREKERIVKERYN